MTRVANKGLIITALLLAVFLSVLFRNEPKLQNPLVDMKIESTTPKNATLAGDVPTIKDVLKDNVQKGNYILQGNIVIPEGVSVQIEAGTVFYANRDAKITVLGEINATNVSWLSNQVYSQRRYWHGLVAEQKGKITFSGCNIQDATTALTALRGGQIHVSGELKNNIVGIASLQNGKASTNNLQITDGTVGIQLIGGSATIENTVFEKLTDGLRIFHNSNLVISQSSFQKITRYAIRRDDQGDLILKNIKSTAPLSVYDGKDYPTYTKEGKVYKNGKVEFTDQTQ